MKMINTLAWANTKYHKGKNLLSAIAVVLTTVLIFLVITIGIGVVNVQNHVVNKTYPTWHAMYRNVSEEKKDELLQHADIDAAGLRQDVGQSKSGESELYMMYLDDEAQRLNKAVFTEGSAPKKENEVALTRETLSRWGYAEAAVGDEIHLSYQKQEEDGLSLETQGVFKLSGILPDSEEGNKKGVFSMLVSENLMEEMIPETERSYRVMIRVPESVATSTDAVEEICETIGSSFGVQEMDVVINSEYLFANYVDPSFLTGVAVLVVIIVVAGALTIYSIYYVSLINKVQEFGKLKALGATKRQIRQAVLRENLIVAGAAIPTGLLIGIVSTVLFFNKIMLYFMNDAVSMKGMKEALENGEVQLILPWVVALTIVVSLTTVIVSSLKPMRQAGKILPIEAMRYTGQSVTKQTKRQGFTDITLEKLAGATLSRNKKRTVMTIFSLGAIGVLFVVVSTVFNCMQPSQIARDSIAEDFRLSIGHWSGDKMNPEREWKAIQQNNPLDDTMKNEIAAIPGVVSVEDHLMIDGETPELLDLSTNEPLEISITGINEERFGELQSVITAGSVTYEELTTGDVVLASDIFAMNYPEVKAGDVVEVTLFDGDQSYSKELKIAAIGNFTQAQSNYGTFISSNEGLQTMSDNNLTSYYDIKSEPKQESSVKEALSAITSSNELLELETYEEALIQWQSVMLLITGAGYGIMAILGVVGIMNLINTTIDSILTRKKELGVMQAIGMSNKQMKRMLQSEGLFYAFGIAGTSVILGSLLGYGVYAFAAAKQLMQIREYYYPVLQVVLLVAVVFIVQLVLTAVTTNLVNREAVIDRIKGAE